MTSGVIVTPDLLDEDNYLDYYDEYDQYTSRLPGQALLHANLATESETTEEIELRTPVSISTSRNSKEIFKR